MNRIQALGVSLILLAAAAAEAGALSGSSYFRTRGPFVEPPYVLQKPIQPTPQTPSLPRQGGAAATVNGQSALQKSIISSSDHASPATTDLRSPYQSTRSSAGGRRLPSMYLTNPSSSRGAGLDMSAPLGMDEHGSMAAFLANLLSSQGKRLDMSAPREMDRPGGMTSGR